ncbi:glutathione S-transferase N-terminal domain-containing protein [Alphaproteobacteria bacterium]|nr:glutathione S-transferase N-terminal domain-containing protein [Alphaproteobacteria bacterium]
MTDTNKYPILYSFRRCPYAMRARLAIRASDITVEIREIKLQNKPVEFLRLSPKATVPLLVTNSQQILDESLDIMNWALRINDSKNWLGEGKLNRNEVDNILTILELEFKQNLDKYKYPTRYKNVDKNFYRDRNLIFLNKLNNLLKANKALNCSHLSLIDYAIFPFIRQFRNVDQKWFDSLNFNFLKDWLYQIIDSEDFLSIMKKYKLWEPNQKPIFTKFFC